MKIIWQRKNNTMNRTKDIIDKLRSEECDYKTCYEAATLLEQFSYQESSSKRDYYMSIVGICFLTVVAIIVVVNM